MKGKKRVFMSVWFLSNNNKCGSILKVSLAKLDLGWSLENIKGL
jgi:hypothetical protein